MPSGGSCTCPTARRACSHQRRSLSGSVLSFLLAGVSFLGVLASAESLSGSVRTALGWNATGLVAVAMLLLALALPDAHATFSTPQRVLLPLSLLLNQALICVALRALAAAAGTTAKVWELDVSLLAHPQGA